MPLLLACLAVWEVSGDESAASASLEVSPREATVGDPLNATLEIELPEGTRLETKTLGPTLGPFEVWDGSWSGPEQQDGAVRWTWNGTLAAFRTGSLEVPAIEVRVSGSAGEELLRADPVEITIRSVLPAEGAAEEPPELADLKAPARIPPDYGSLRLALLILALLLAVSALIWWLNRRYGSRLAAVAAPVDPFRRLPPHVWAYEELQRLLEQRLAEKGQVDRFFSELSRILKRYLSGRYRVELMERTTGEVLPLLRQAGAPADPTHHARALLERCDLVKFARDIPEPQACRSVVEEAYDIVDATRPVEESREPRQGAA